MDVKVCIKMSAFYVYSYLRKDGTPYYIGKGKGRRAFEKSINHYPPEDKSRIVFIKENLDEYEALDLEKRMIRWYGRKDLGTGILRNLTDGGEGGSLGKIFSEETRTKMSKARKGNKHLFGKKMSEETRRKMSEAKKGNKHNLGRKLSEKHKTKLSQMNSGEKNPFFGKQHSEETRKKISQAMRRAK